MLEEQTERSRKSELLYEKGSGEQWAWRSHDSRRIGGLHWERMGGLY